MIAIIVVTLLIWGTWVALTADSKKLEKQRFVDDRIAYWTKIVQDKQTNQHP